MNYDPNKQYDEYDLIDFLDSVVSEARALRDIVKRDDHWCLGVEVCQKCKTLESFDRALAELDKLQGR